MRQRYSVEVQLLLFSLLVLGMFVWLFLEELESRNRLPGSIPVTQQVGNGGKIFLLRFPKSPEVWEEITIRDAITGDPPEIMRNPVDTRNATGEDYIYINPTPEEWEQVITFGRNWCQHTPVFREPEEGEPFFDLGIQCNNMFDERGLQIPADELPPDLVQLIEMVPSPHCAAPLCGW